MLGTAATAAHTATCTEVDAAFTIHETVDAIFSSRIVNRSLAETLHGAAERVRSAASRCTAVSGVFDVTGHPTIDAIRSILGPEDSSEAGDVQRPYGAEPVTTYHFDWLGFVADGRGEIVMLNVRFKA